MSNFLPKNPAWSEIHAHDLNLVIACANVSSIINNLFNIVIKNENSLLFV